MNTKTMRLPPRRVLTSNKRKDCEGYDSLKPSSPIYHAPSSSLPSTPTKLAKPVQPAPLQAKKKLLPEPPAVSSNQLLAGYLAHEYLTKGTLFGQQWDPSKPQAEPNKKIKLSQKFREAEPGKDNYQRYVEVSNLLMREEGAHLPGVFNPSQLARFLQMG
ncbi:embryo sac development arrest 6 [Euphorbia peplus]|nr:embryo sac development arrest 6 [Euphorbia peplus]